MVPTTTVQVIDGPAKAAQIKDGDTIVSINGGKVTDWEDLRRRVMTSGAGKPIEVGVTRKGQPLTIPVTPMSKDGRMMIGVQPVNKQVPVTLKERASSPWWCPQEWWRSGREVSSILTARKAPTPRPSRHREETSRAADEACDTSLARMLSDSLGGFNCCPSGTEAAARFWSYEAITVRPTRRWNARPLLRQRHAPRADRPRHVFDGVDMRGN